MELSISNILIISISLFFIQLSQCTTIVVDGDAISKWKNPAVHIGDSIIFKDEIHQYNKLYIFKNERAFNLCNFTQAYLLTKPNSTFFTWYPSRSGLFFFTFDNGSHIPCKQGKKLAIQVSFALSKSPQPSPPATTPPAPSIISTPGAGGSIASSPSSEWPIGSLEPGQSPSAATSPDAMPLLPDKGGGLPFINSNPAVPLPTGEVDSTTIHPLPISSAKRDYKMLKALVAAVQMILYFTVFGMT